MFFYSYYLGFAIAVTLFLCRSSQLKPSQAVARATVWRLFYDFPSPFADVCFSATYIMLQNKAVVVANGFIDSQWHESRCTFPGNTVEAEDRQRYCWDFSMVSCTLKRDPIPIPSFSFLLACLSCWSLATDMLVGDMLVGLVPSWRSVSFGILKLWFSKEAVAETPWLH